MTTKIYRADNFYHQMGDLIGFYSSKEEAINEINFSNEISPVDAVGEFSQITEFEIETSALTGVSVDDSDRMLQEDIWGAGEIVKEYYFK